MQKITHSSAECHWKRWCWQPQVQWTLHTSKSQTVSAGAGPRSRNAVQVMLALASLAAAINHRVSKKEVTDHDKWNLAGVSSESLRLLLKLCFPHMLFTIARTFEQVMNHIALFKGNFARVAVLWGGSKEDLLWLGAVWLVTLVCSWSCCYQKGRVVSTWIKCEEMLLLGKAAMVIFTAEHHGQTAQRMEVLPNSIYIKVS